MLTGTPCNGPSLSPLRHGLLGLLGVAPRFLRHHHAKAVEPGLGTLDRLQDGVDIVDRRKLPGADEGGGLHGRHEEQIGIGHAATISDPRHDLPRALRRAPMFSLLVLAALAVVAVVTSFISGIFGMAGGMLLIGFLLVLLPVPVAMVFHGVIQIAANGWRAWLWRHHVKWSVVLQFGAGAAASLIVFSFFNFVPDKALVLMVVGLTPFVALAVPQRIAPDIERGGQAFLAGVIGGAMQLVSGVTGPLLDIFYVRTGMTRQVNVATKAAAQVLGHLTKVAYFAVVIDRSGRPRPRAVAGHGLCRLLRRAGHHPVAQFPRPPVGQAVLSLDAPRDPGAGRGLCWAGRLADGDAMSAPEKIDVKAEVRALLDRLPDDCTLRRRAARHRRADVAQARRRQPQAAASACEPEEVKRRLREWLKSEKDK